MTDHLLLFLLATYGLTAIMIVGHPVTLLRRLLARILGEHFIGCWLCMGFWCAIVCWLTLEFVSEIPLWVLAGAGAAYFINNFASEKEGEICDDL